jgi:hypothetical protein
MYPVKNPARDARPGIFSSTRWAAIKLLLLCLVTASVPYALYVRVDSKNLKAALTTPPAGSRGGSYLNVQQGQALRSEYLGERSVIQAMESGQAKARTLASVDLDGDATPDLLAGYAYGGTGIVTIQRGNPEAFAPKDESVYLRMHEGYNPSSLLPTAETYQVPVAADFLQAGDFNNDNRKDVVVAAQGGDLFLLAGDGSGNLSAPVKVELPGVVTALAAGEFRAPDGRTDLAVGVDGPSGPQVLIYDGASGVSSEPMRLALAGRATGLEFGEMDGYPFMGLAVATGSEIEIVHGWGRKTSPTLESRVEKIDTGMNVRGLASGFFMWSREGSKQLAALGDDGTIRIFGRGQLNTQPLTEEELTARGRLRLQPKNTTPVDVEMLTGWQPAQAENWTKSRELVTGKIVGADATTRNLLQGADISFSDTDDLMVLGGGSKLDLISQVDTTKSAPAGANLISGDFAVNSLESADTPATLALPRKLNGWGDVVVMQSDSTAVTLVPLAPTATITVDLTTDPAITASGVGAAACTGAAGDCSLRGAVQFANSNSGTVINLSTATYVLATSGTNGCLNENAITGNRIGDLEVNETTTITGTGAANSIIRQGSAVNDRVFCLDTTLAAGRTFAFSALTITGGRDVGSNVGGGGIIGGAKSTTLNLTNVTFANNQTTGPATSGGGGVGVTGGDMNVTNCTFGAANNPGANKNDLTLGNAANSLSGGGLDYSAGDPLGSNGATGTLAISGTTFTHNTSSSVSSGGGGLSVYEFNTSVATTNLGTSAFTSNAATGTASGGGIMNQSQNQLNISTTSFTTNSAGNRGGGLYVAGGHTLLDGTTPSITFSGNTATTAGSSISAASFVNVSGLNTIVGGDLEITTNGFWTNNAGSAISPTNFIMTGTANFTGNNSTTNVSGNFNFGSGTFNAGTGIFNFNGSAPAQSITSASVITFNNLTDSNITNPLTLNSSIAVGGTLNINGANAIFAPVAAAVISGGGTLTGTGTARVTRTGADSFFSQYAMTGGRTLTNLTVEYIGAALQTASVTTYSNLKINNGTGVNLGALTTTVNGTLTLQAGALGVGTSTLVINNGTTVVGGSITSGATGTVNYNQSSAGQAVIAANYGNLTFSAFTKVLPAIGTVGIAGTFNVNGVTTGHTITGSTIDFNGTGAQTVPVFSYNNLTISGARAGATVTLGAGTIGVAGTFNPSATAVVYSKAGNLFDFNGTGAQTVPVFNFNDLTISGNRGGAAITLAPGIIGIAGVFNPSVTNNTFVTTGNTVNFNGSAAQSIPAFTFGGLTITNLAGVNLAGAVTVNGSLLLASGALGVNTNTLTLNGAASFGAGTLTSSATGTVIYNQQSNGQATVLAANYGNLTFSNFSKTLASTGTIGIAGTFTPGTGTGHTITGSTINFNGAGSQNIPGFTYFNLTSSGGGVARVLDPVNTIKIAGAFTPGADIYTVTGSTIEYNGSAPQSLPGTFTPYNNLTFNNPTTVTGGPATLDVNGNLQITQGTFAAGGSLSITVGGNWTNNGGAFTPSTGDVTFDGGAGQTIGGTTATTFNNLSVGNASGLAMTNDNTVNGNLALVGSDITVAATKTLTQPVGGNSSGSFDVNGRVQRTGFVTGVCAAAPCANTLRFGNPNNQITVTSGTAPVNIVVDLTRTVPIGAQGFPTAVQRYYTITPASNAFTGTLRLRYLETELNGNVEGANFIFRRFNGTGWQPVLPTTTDFVNNWLEKTGVTQFSPWTFNSTFAPTASNGVITGRIVDNNGAPVEGAVVRLEGTQNRKFITDANGVYRFEKVETNGFYTVTPSRANYTFSPASKSFSQVGEATEATFGATTASSTVVNPLDTPEYFVRQHYIDFLGREPDEAGFNFWSDEIIACGADQECVGRKRENVSAAYFLSIEFQATGGLVDGLYRAGYQARPQFSQFMTDTHAVGLGVVVGADGWQAKLQVNKDAFATAFINRPGFIAAYGSLDNGAFVDTLISQTGVSFAAGDREALVTGLTQGTMTRAQALTAIAENERFVNAKFNDAFVMMEYFGYLRRDPDASGFQYWLDKLNHFGGNFQQAEMVKAFIVSGEYRDRFPK